MRLSQTRRDFLRLTGSALPGLALGAAIRPFTMTRNADAETIKVGILHSLTGFLASQETPLRDAELMAIEEINKAGGMLGKKIEPIVEDPQSDFTKGFPAKATKLLLEDKVACLFGCRLSVSRKFILPIVEKANGLLFYPAAYEGSECSKNVVYSGAVPNQQVLPAVDYLWQKMNKRKFCLLGSDYIFPRYLQRIVTAHLKEVYKAAPVLERFVPLGHIEFQDVVNDLKAKKPDVILSSLYDDSNGPFFDELAAKALKADDLPVCSFTLSEEQLRSLEPAKVKGHLAAATYFQAVDTQENKGFVRDFKAKYGKERVIDDAVETAYFQVYLWKTAVEKARSVDVNKVREALHGLELKAPGGPVKVDAKNLHTWKPLRIGKIHEDRQFDIIHDSKELIRPEPYPKVAFPGWDCDWTKGGVVKP